MTIRDVTSIDSSSTNITSEFLFNINAGMLGGITQERKYGENEDIDPSSSPELVRSGGGYLEDYPYLTTNTQLYAVSDFALCTATIKVYGVVEDDKGNWNLKDVEAQLNGSTPVPIGEFIRVFRVRVVACPASQIVGNIYISELSVGIPTQGQTHARLAAGEGSSLMAMYTVPSGHTAFVYRLFGSTGRAQDASFTFRAKPYGGVFRTLADFSVYESAIQLEVGYEPISAKTDVVVLCRTLTQNTQVRASFHFILVKNSLIKT